LYPNGAGQVLVDFTIEATGAVTNARVSRTAFDSPAFARCLTSAVLTWVFPRPSDGGRVRVNYPFSFGAHP
jgi:TonB family protein